MSKIKNATIKDNKIYCPNCGSGYKDTLLEKYGLAKDKNNEIYYEFVRRCTKCQTIMSYYQKELGDKRINLNNMIEVKEKNNAKEDVDG